MSPFTSAMAVSWSGVSWYGKASSSSRCHGRVLGEGVAGLVEALLVEHDELLGDLATPTERTLALAFCQPSPPRRLRVGDSPPV